MPLYLYRYRTYLAALDIGNVPISMSYQWIRQNQSIKIPCPLSRAQRTCRTGNDKNGSLHDMTHDCGK